MKEHRMHLKIAAFILLFSTSVAADCMMSGPCYTITGNLDQTNNKGFIITAPTICNPYTTTPTVTFTDTLYESDYIARLRNLYTNSEVVVIASVYKAVQFIPPLSEIGKTVFAAESVTVKIESVLKGQMQPVWNYIYQLTNPSYQLYYDSITGQNKTSVMMLSHSEPTHASIVNDRFILFFTHDQIPANSQSFKLPISKDGCNPYSNAFKVNIRNHLFFDGYEIDTVHKTVTAIPEMTVLLDKFVASVGPSAIVPNRQSRAARQFSEVITSYNLLGKKLPIPHALQTHLASGCFVRKTALRNESRTGITTLQR